MLIDAPSLQTLSLRQTTLELYNQILSFKTVKVKLDEKTVLAFPGRVIDP